MKLNARSMILVKTYNFFYLLQKLEDLNEAIKNAVIN